MTPNRITVAFEKYGPEIPEERHGALRATLAKTSNSCTDEFMFLPIKKKVITILLSIFLGGLGIDRFYVGDTKLGICKLVCNIVARLTSNLIPVIGPLFNAAVGIWVFADIFFSYKSGKEYNYRFLSSFASRYPERSATSSPVATPTPRPATRPTRRLDIPEPQRRKTLSEFVREMELEETGGSRSNEGGKVEDSDYVEPQSNAPAVSENAMCDDGRRAGEDTLTGRSTDNPFSY